MKTVFFRRVNVFTDRAFSGNPLVVVPDAVGLDVEEMQAIAREMGVSETTFVFSPTVKEATYKVRIFTPAQEIPFAGHPSLGTAFVMAELGRFPLVEPSTIIRQELLVGVLPIELEISGGEVVRVVMTQKETELGTPVTEIEDLTEALGIESLAIHRTGLPVEILSTGVPQLFVPLPTLDAVSQLRPKFFELREIERKLGVIGCCVFSLSTHDPTALAHVRFFAPNQNVREDPATGSAAGGLGAYLAVNKLLPKSGEFWIEQGEEMGRPSKIHVQVKVNKVGHPYKVKVGGSVMPAMEGSLSF